MNKTCHQIMSRSWCYPCSVCVTIKLYRNRDNLIQSSTIKWELSMYESQWWNKIWIFLWPCNYHTRHIDLWLCELGLQGLVLG